MSDWAPLRRFITCVDGKRVPLNREERSSMQGDVPYWGAGGVMDHIDRHIFNEELVLLGEDGAPFFDSARDVAFRVSGRTWVNNHIHALRPHTNIDARYLMYSLNITDYSNYISGSTRDKLTQEDMLEIPIKVLTINEQRRIADFLDIEISRIQELAVKHSQVQSVLRQRRTAVVDKLLESSGGHEMKLARLLTSLRDGTHQPPPRVDAGVPLLTARNISSGLLRLTEQDTYISQLDASILERSIKLRGLDVLLSVKGTVGACALVPLGFPRATLDRNVALLRTSDNAHPTWLLWSLRSRRVQDQIRLSTTFAAQPGLPLNEISRLRILTPSIDKQVGVADEIESEVNSIDTCLARLDNVRSLLAERRRALITAAVTGQLDVTTARSGVRG